MVATICNPIGLPLLQVHTRLGVQLKLHVVVQRPIFQALHQIVVMSHGLIISSTWERGGTTANLSRWPHMNVEVPRWPLPLDLVQSLLRVRAAGPRYLCPIAADHSTCVAYG